MNDSIRVRDDAFIRIDQFGKDNAADFPALSIGGIQFAIIAAIILLIQQLSGDQAAGFGESQFAFNSKGNAREDLRSEMQRISDMARAMVYEFPGIHLLFRMPYNNNDAQMLASAIAFHTEALTFKDNFITYGLPADFMGQLQAAIDAFEQSLGAPGSAIDARVEATAELGDAVRRGMIARRILDAVVKNKYRNDVGKLAAWASARHIEKLPKDDVSPVNP